MNTETMANFRKADKAFLEQPDRQHPSTASLAFLSPWGWKIDEDGNLMINFESKNLACSFPLSFWLFCGRQ